MKKVSLILLIIISLLTITGCSNTEFNGTIKEFKYDDFYDTEESNQREIKFENDNYVYRHKITNTDNPIDVEFYITKDKIVELTNLINSSKINEWNGFNKEDRKNKNNHNFIITATYDDDKFFSCSGYMKFPDDYENRIKKLNNYFNNLDEELKKLSE